MAGLAVLFSGAVDTVKGTYQMLDAYDESSFEAMMKEWATGVTAALD